ncbi:hypothetical protein NXS19_014234 [Fusarium pseudograminearum]|nr:hypothetical protein NXS19_014234 [Fusarium pseudograminearum]
MLLLYNFDVDEKDKYGNTAFNKITDKTTIPVLETLKTWGASIDIANEEGEVPLCNAIRFSNEPVSNWLVKQGANVNISIGKQESILHIACSEGSLEMVKLLRKNNATLSSVNHDNSTPLHIALLRSDEGKEAIVYYLLSMKGLDVNHSSEAWGSSNASLETIDLMGRNALHFAVVSGRLDVVTLVLNKHPDYIHQTDIDGWSPLMWAVRICGKWDTREDERTKIISELIARGANPHISGEGLDRKWTACDLAYYYGHGRDVIDLLEPQDEMLEHGELQDKDIDNQRAAKIIKDNYCDACLLNNYGFRFQCDVCEDFDLCFKCYRSQNTIHPKHSFTNPSGRCVYAEDSSSDGSSSDSGSTEEETSSEEEGNGSGGGSGEESDDGSDAESQNDSC